jgi:hypothetical protein
MGTTECRRPHLPQGWDQSSDLFQPEDEVRRSAAGKSRRGQVVLEGQIRLPDADLLWLHCKITIASRKTLPADPKFGSQSTSCSKLRMQSCTSNLTLVKLTLWLGVRNNLEVAGRVNGLEAEICGALKAVAKHCSAFNCLRVQYL